MKRTLSNLSLSEEKDIDELVKRFKTSLHDAKESVVQQLSQGKRSFTETSPTLGVTQNFERYVRGRVEPKEVLVPKVFTEAEVMSLLNQEKAASFEEGKSLGAKEGAMGVAKVALSKFEDLCEEVCESHRQHEDYLSCLARQERSFTRPYNCYF